MYTYDDIFTEIFNQYLITVPLSSSDWIIIIHVIIKKIYIMLKMSVFTEPAIYKYINVKQNYIEFFGDCLFTLKHVECIKYF